MKTSTSLLLNLLAFTGGFTFTSIFISKSTNWYFSLPLFIIILILFIINLRKK